MAPKFDNGSPRLARLYIAGVAGLALTLFVVSRIGDSRSLLPSDRSVAIIVPLFVAASVAAQRFRLHLTYQTKVNVDTAVFVAAALLLDVPTAIAVAATSGVIYSMLQWDSWDETIFNMAQSALSVGAASAAFHALRDTPGLPSVPSLGSLLAVIVCGLVLLFLNTWTVATVSALHAGAPPVRSWLGSLWLDTPENAALMIVGVVVAIVAIDHPWFLPAFFAPIALIYHSLRRSIELRTATHEAIDELAEIVDRRDPSTQGHSERVASLIHQLALHLGLSTRDVEIVTGAARVHDVGMVAIDPRLVAKPGCLSRAERDEVQRHAVVGADLLARFPQFVVGARAVRHHHECWDGSGYPDRLAGETIPFAARMIAVVDAYDALTTHRPHRSALNPANALAELERGAGRQWDPTVVAAFVTVMREELARPDQRPAPTRLLTPVVAGAE